MGLIALEQALRIRFRASLFQDLIAALVLIQPAQYMDGLGDWIYRISNRLLADPPADFYATTTTLAFVPGMHGWMVAQIPDEGDIESILTFLETISLDELGPICQQALADYTRNFDLPRAVFPITRFEDLNAHLKRIQEQRENLYHRPKLAVPTEVIADYLLTPERLQQGLISSLKALWENGYAETYPEARQRWQHAIEYHTRQNYQADFAAIFRTVTGRPIPKPIQEQAERARTLEWHPSCYVGTYVVFSRYGDTLRISFNANLTPALNIESDKLVGLYPAMRAMADENRLHILGLLLHQEYSVGDLAELLHLSASTVSRHLTLLAKTDLVTVRPQGNLRYYRLNPDGFSDIIERLHAVMEK
ncbi:MAG: metalloregulator ArsR/SmtB family transcription factor [Anaerolineae bacterium]|nr:metalloregulator ArsR/SmtB family transcription factor [Anaerolineae bacterium]